MEKSKQRAESDGEVEAVASAPLKHRARARNHERIPVRGLQLLVVEEVREEERAALVVVELAVREVCWPKGCRQKLRKGVLVRRTEEEETFAVHLEELLLKETHVLQEQLLLRNIKAVPLIHLLVLVREPATPNLLGGAHGVGLP